MRITNKMMTTNSLNDINKNKNLLNKLQQQYSTGKKISTPSEDPITAVRALKLRSNYVELNQYLEKNIPSAQSWLDQTEGSLTNMNTMLTTAYEQFTQGANDTLSVTDRDSILKTLQEISKQMYQEGNAEYAGRYVFTGYKTDTSLSFTEDTKHLSYAITETFSGKDISSITTVVNGYSAGAYDPATSTEAQFTNTPETVEAYRIRLSYGNLAYDEADLGGEIEYKVGDDTFKAKIVSSSDPDAYTVAEDGEAHFIPETGELIFSKKQYDAFSTAKDNDISITYEKDSFNQYDLRPEHYFNTTVTDTTKAAGEIGHTTTYTMSDQQIQYEINFGQKLTVNTQGKDCLTHTFAREVEELTAILNKMASLEADLADVKNKLAEDNLSTDQRAALTKLEEQLNTQYTLQTKIMSDKFSKGMTTTKELQTSMNSAVSDLGARYSRLELTENRLKDQQTELEDLISTNEDADLVETVIKYNSQQTIYNAALSVAAKAVKNTLLDYI
ncbi:MAG: flagellar hook-associated protein FlgL [bacterium]|nr:flagellar hook-associated protein FlgL [bacterium]